jgi:hypothetical protein
MQEALTPTITLGENVQISGGDTPAILAPIPRASRPGVPKSRNRVV